MASTKVLTVPVNSILRNPYRVGSVACSVATRGNAFENTLTKLTDPATGRELYLVGTTHGSTTLALRTKKLIEEVQPDNVLVQTSEEWSDLVGRLNLTNQSDLTRLNSQFRHLNFSGKALIQNNFRGAYFKFNFAAWSAILKTYLSMPTDFHPFEPGLEIKYAIDAARETGANLDFAGPLFDGETMKGLETATSMTPINLLIRLFQMRQKERLMAEVEIERLLYSKYASSEGYSEYLDTRGAYWWSKFFELIDPSVKEVIFDRKDESLFLRLFRESEAKTTVAVVNQFHVPGIESMWRNSTGTQKDMRPVNPVGDMDINAYSEAMLEGDFLARRVAETTKSEISTSEHYNTQYMDTTHEHERARHAFFLGADDPHMNHALFNNENKDVEYASPELRGEGHH